MFKFKQIGPLEFIVAGFEHSGTTLVSEILRQHPKLDSAFEGGLLLTKKLRDFVNLEPFSSNFKEGWKVTDDELTDICSSRDYAEAYLKLRQFSRVIEDKKTNIFDKTPRYMQRLPTVLKKIRDLKSVVVVRDMRSLMDSTIARSDEDIDKWIETVYPITKRHTLSYLDGLTVALNDSKLKNRILVIRYEELILNQEQKCQDLFDFLGYKFKSDYLNFQNVRYSRNVYGDSIQSDYITKYKLNLPTEFIDQVIRDFSLYSEYFWNV